MPKRIKSTSPANQFRRKISLPKTGTDNKDGINLGEASTKIFLMLLPNRPEQR